LAIDNNGIITPSKEISKPVDMGFAALSGLFNSFGNKTSGDLPPEFLDVNQPELKECPFCGGKAELRFDTGLKSYFIVCSNCKVETNIDAKREEVIKLWNRRYVV